MFDLFDKFKKLMLEEYPNILIGMIIEDESYYIHYYLENFDINDMHFHEIIGKSIKETFYKKGVFNIGLEYLVKEELHTYFPHYSQKLDLKSILKSNLSNSDLRKDEIIRNYISQNIVSTNFSLVSYQNIKKQKLNSVFLKRDTAEQIAIDNLNLPEGRDLKDTTYFEVA